MSRRVLICGGRDYADLETMRGHISDDIPSVIIVGRGKGADQLAELIADEKGIPVLPFPPDYKRLGTDAPKIRNQRMITDGKPEEVWAYPTPSSKGTWDMVNKAKKCGIPVRIRCSLKAVGQMEMF